jgi:hypothetical protein
MLRSYATAMRIALHWLEGHGGEAAAARLRAAAAFAECEAVERRCGAELAKCGSNLRKLGERALVHARQPAGAAHVDGEEMSGARALALLAVYAGDKRAPRCEVVLSDKGRRGRQRADAERAAATGR